MDLAGNGIYPTIYGHTDLSIDFVSACDDPGLEMRGSWNSRFERRGSEQILVPLPSLVERGRRECRFEYGDVVEKAY